MTAQIQVIKRDSMPPIREVEVDGVTHAIGEVRDFRVSEELRNFMPDSSELSVSWARLDAFGTHHPHVHPIQSMMVICDGSGQLIGDLNQSIKNGDVIVVPAGCLHGLIAGAEGLSVLSIQFDEALCPTNGEPRAVPSSNDSEQALAALLKQNAQCSSEFSKHPIFSLLSDGTLDAPHKLKAFLRSMNAWRDVITRVMLWRQASCADLKLQQAFLQDLSGELRARSTSNQDQESSIQDPILGAICSWFSFQMLTLDDVEKAAMSYLVLESARAEYHSRSVGALEQYIDGVTLPPGTSGLAAIRARWLQDQSPNTYLRLAHLVRETWDMVNAMADRIVELTRAE